MKHYLAAVLGFAIWGTFSLVLRPLSGYPSLDILLYRVLFASFFVTLACLAFRRHQTRSSIRYIRGLDIKSRRLLFINLIASALLLAVNWYLFIYVMNNISVNATALAYLVCPIITTVLAGIFLRERLSKMQLLAVGICILSCLILAYGHFLDMLFSAVIALTYAAYLVLQKNKFEIDRLVMLAMHILVATLFLVPLVVASDFSTPKPVMFFSYIGLISIMYTIVPLMLNMYALKGLDSSVVGILLYLNPLIGFCLAIFYFQEPVNDRQLIAFLMIIIAVIIFNVSYINGKRHKLPIGGV